MKNRQPFSCKRDTFTIRGDLYGADTDHPKPAVIFSHGFLANRKMCEGYAQLLASVGFVTAVYDFCGGGLGVKSDGRSEDMTVLTEKEDLHAVYTYLSEQNFVRKDSISLLGCSQGGFVSALFAAEHPELVSKLILFYPALCIPDDARKGHMMFFHFDPAHIPQLLGRIPMKLGGEYARCVINMDPFEEISGYEGPVLLLHGTEDDIVDISYAERAASVYQNCTFAVIEGGGHMFRGRHDEKAKEILKNFMKLQ